MVRGDGVGLYGPDGFFRRGAPAEHFRTSVHIGPVFAGAVAELLARADAALGRPPSLDVVDVGAGRGELLSGLLDLVPPALGDRLRATAVEIADRPDGLRDDISWVPRVPEAVTGLLIATEWLDNVPLDVAVPTDDGWRYVLVDDSGAESIGEPLSKPDLDWVREWWPDGERVEIGVRRDAAWASAVAALRAGVAVAVDYGHTRASRPRAGTIAGFRDGREYAAVPNGDFDISAFVAFDSLGDGLLMRQRDALAALGVSGRRPPLALASADPAAYVRALAAASRAGELTDESGLGGHRWLVRTVGVDPGALRMTA